MLYVAWCNTPISMHPPFKLKWNTLSLCISNHIVSYCGDYPSFYQDFLPKEANLVSKLVNGNYIRDCLLFSICHKVNMPPRGKTNYRKINCEILRLGNMPCLWSNCLFLFLIDVLLHVNQLKPLLLLKDVVIFTCKMNKMFPPFLYMTSLCKT